MSPNQESSTWQTTSIGKSAYLRGRIGWQGLKASEFMEDGPFLVTGTDFTGGRINWDSCYHVSEARYAEAEYIHLQNDDVLITKDGTIGKVAFVEECPDQAVLNSGIFLIRCKDNSFQHRYIFHLLRSNIFGRFLDDNVAGSTIKHLYQHVFKTFEVPIPEPLEQTAIVEILSTVDRAIEQTDKVINKQRRLKTGLMLDLLSRGIDEHGSLRCQSIHTFKSSALGMIPVEWEVKPIGDLLADVDPAMRSGPFGSALLKDELVESGIPLLGIDNVFAENFVDAYTRFVDPRKAKTLRRYRVRPRDLMITIMGTVGRCCVVPDDIGTALSSKHTWTISLNQRLYSPYLACLQINYAPWVLSHFAKDEQGGIMSSIKSDTLRSTLLPVPPFHEMMAIEEKLRAISSEIDLNSARLQKLNSLRAALMQGLLSGTKRVTALLKPESKRNKVYAAC
jgi:type I restriction enzyme, S subunit